jgi:phosphoglycerate dehydrogenase-like enzyme
MAGGVDSAGRAAVLAMADDLPGRLLDEPTRDRLRSLVDIDFSRTVRSFDDPEVVRDLEGIEVIITGWGSPRIDATVLAAAPRLRAVLHAAGSVRGHVAPECWDRGVVVSSAADANALPVAEYTVAMILLAGKGVFAAQQLYRERRGRVDQRAELGDAGNYRRAVGIVGASRIGRRMIDLLRPYYLDVRLSDPYADPESAERLGVTLMDLDALLRAAEVVSVHASLLPDTVHLIDGRRLALLRDAATLVNTARGGLVDLGALVAELSSGRIHAVLDVTDPAEPLPSGSPLFDLPNVVLTPHVAGALGNERFRLGAFAAAELERFLDGRPLAGLVTADDLARMA